MNHNVSISLANAIIQIVMVLLYGILCLGILAATIQIVVAIAPMIFIGAFVTGIVTAIIRGG